MITLYDYPSNRKENDAWNPIVWKTRFCLNYKGIPHKTAWIEYPDVDSTLEAIGANATKKPDGSPGYTLPAIYDDSTGVALTESNMIAEYLDKTYPNTPTLIPPGIHAFQSIFQQVFPSKIAPAGLLGFAKVAALLNPRSEEYFRRTREAQFGKKLEEMVPEEKVPEEWAKFKKGLGDIDGWMRKEDMFMMGDTPCLADFSIVSFVLSVKNIWGEDSAQWKDVMSWHDGRWARLVRHMEKYQQVL